MGFFDKLASYINEGDEARKNLIEEFKFYSTYELLSMLGRILYSQHKTAKNKGSVSAIINSVSAPPEKRSEYSAILSVLEDRGIDREEAITRAIDSI